METVPHIPLPAIDSASVVVEPPGDQPGYWAGAPSAVFIDNAFWLTYRTRLPVGAGRGVTTVVARSDDGVSFETVSTVHKADFGAESFERPAILKTPEGKWQLYVSCATPGSKHWWIDVLEADDPSAFSASERRTVFPGDDLVAMKDPIIKLINGRYYAWICCHPLEARNDEDRMTTRLAVSDDTHTWKWMGDVLLPRAGTWDARGARVADVLLRSDTDQVVVYYDGRVTADENCEERTGLAFGPLDGPYAARDGGPVAEAAGGYRGLRYLSIVPLSDGAHRMYFEASRPDGSHDLRTQLIR